MAPISTERALIKFSKFSVPPAVMRIARGAADDLHPREARKTSIRLVLVEDHAVLREGLKALLELESDVQIVGEFGCAESSVDAIRRLQPDVVVVDLALRSGSGIELIGEIQHLSPTSRKLVLTGSDGAQYIRAALCAGADGYVLKDSSRAELLLAIRTVAMGRRFLCKAIASKVLSDFQSRGEPRPAPIGTHSITARERQVLSRIAQGHTNKVVAHELRLSPTTVAKHRSNLMRKLQLHNVAAVTMYAIKNGLVGSDMPETHPAATCRREFA